MSNRRKPARFSKRARRDKAKKALALAAGVEEVDGEQTVLKYADPGKTIHKIVPAKADGEIIGKCIIYEDGTIQVISNDNLTDTQRRHIVNFEKMMAGEDGDFDEYRS